MKTRRTFIYFYTLRSIITYSMYTERMLPQQIQTVSDRIQHRSTDRFHTNWMIYISRKTRFLQITGCMEQGIWHDEQK